MTRKEIEERIEELETRSFYLAMKDRWSREDYDLDAKMFHEIRELKALLAE